MFCLPLRNDSARQETYTVRSATRARNLRKIYFLKLLCFCKKKKKKKHNKKKNNQPPCEPCQGPRWTTAALFTWRREEGEKKGRKKNLAWAAAFINFPSPPFFFRPLACLPWIGKKGARYSGPAGRPWMHRRRLILVQSRRCLPIPDKSLCLAVY